MIFSWHQCRSTQVFLQETKRALAELRCLLALTKLAWWLVVLMGQVPLEQQCRYVIIRAVSHQKACDKIYTALILGRSLQELAIWSGWLFFFFFLLLQFFISWISLSAPGLPSVICFINHSHPCSPRAFSWLWAKSVWLVSHRLVKGQFCKQQSSGLVFLFLIPYHVRHTWFFLFNLEVAELVDEEEKVLQPTGYYS